MSPFAFLLLAATQGGELVPAGSINDVFASPPVAFVVQEDPAIVRQARGIQGRFFPGCRWVAAEAAADEDLTGHNLIVYGTPDGNAWLKALAERLPFRFGEGSVSVQEQRFEGAHLRVICALRHPQDPERRVLVYAAARAADLVEINALDHGPTQWLVADGPRVLGAGSFRGTTLLSVEDMQRDLDYLVEKLDAVHPATLEGRPEALAEAIEYADIEVGDPLGPEAFWFLVNRVLASLHDAHSSLGGTPSGQPLDLPVRWMADGIVVTRDTKVLRRGDQVLTIGDRDEADLLEALGHLIPAETPNWVRQQAPRGLRDRAVLDHLGIARGDGPVPVTVQRDGRTLTVEVVPGEVSPAPPAEAPPWVRWTVDEAASLGVLTLDQCVINDLYRRTVHEFFAAVHEKGLRRVAVDLRHNGGGNSGVANEFLRYLDLDEYADYGAAVRVSEDSQKQSTLPLPFGYTEHGPQVRANPRVEDLPPFTGEVYLLTAAATFSSGNWFATLLQDNSLATVVGEPTGNSPSAFGDLLRFRLPKSGLSFTLSYKKFLRPDPSRDPAECITPDVYVPTTIPDFRAGRDPVLEYLRGLARPPAPCPLPEGLPDPAALAALLQQGPAARHAALLRDLGARRPVREYLGWSTTGQLEAEVTPLGEEAGPEDLAVLRVGSGGLGADFLFLVCARQADGWRLLGRYEVVSHHSIPGVRLREEAGRRWLQVEFTDGYGTGIGSQRRDLLELLPDRVAAVASWPTRSWCAGWGYALYRDLYLYEDQFVADGDQVTLTLRYGVEYGADHETFADLPLEVESAFRLVQAAPGEPFVDRSDAPLPAEALSLMEDGERRWLEAHTAEAERILTHGDADARARLQRLLDNLVFQGDPPEGQRLRARLAAQTDPDRVR